MRGGRERRSQPYVGLLDCPTQPPATILCIIYFIYENNKREYAKFVSFSLHEYTVGRAIVLAGNRATGTIQNCTAQ